MNAKSGYFSAECCESLIICCTGIHGKTNFEGHVMYLDSAEKLIGKINGEELKLE